MHTNKTSSTTKQNKKTFILRILGVSKGTHRQECSPALRRVENRNRERHENPICYPFCPLLLSSTSASSFSPDTQTSFLSSWIDMVIYGFPAASEFTTSPATSRDSLSLFQVQNLGRTWLAYLGSGPHPLLSQYNVTRLPTFAGWGAFLPEKAVPKGRGGGIYNYFKN